MRGSRNHLLRIGTAVSIAAALIAVLGGVLLWAQPASARGNVGAPVKQSASTNHTITVQGHGEVQVAPDQAKITLGVETRGTDAQTAMSTNASKMNAVIAAIEGQGVPADHIQTSNISLYYDSQLTIYNASNQVTVTLDDVNKVGSVLDAAVAAGANNSWGVSFGIKNDSAAHSQALQSAVADARKRADAMAAALGVSISGVGSASETSAESRPPIPYAAAAPAGQGGSTPVQPGQMTVSSDVTVVYTFG